VSAPVAVCYRFRQFELQPGERRLYAAGKAVALTPRAFNLLVALVEREGRLATKEELLEQVWPRVIVEENTLHRHVSILRKVLGADAIETVPGIGYRVALESMPIDELPTPTPSAAPRHNLVRQLTSFIGRETQLADLKELLQQSQLLTLSGAGGCGKTRLALELASKVCGDYADGVWLVELAALAEPTLVPQTVADVLGLNEHAGETFTQMLLGYLAPKHLLLVLDNAEHLLTACAELVHTLLQRCAQLTVLVTSRERLGVTGEHTFRVPSLSVPDQAQRHVAETLTEYESARLFIERARLHQARFAATVENADAIASICAHLDGIPLAIELAAARVRALSVAELNQRIDQRFRLLADTSSAALPRQRTLRALIDWSYGLLSEEEATVFCRASVCAGGFTLEAAEGILSGDAVIEAAMLDLLTSLVDKNLLLAEETAGTTRYRQLETVRQYGRERLRASGAAPRWERRHFDHFLALAEAAEDGLRGGDRQAWLQRVGSDRENMRTALAFALGQDGDRTAGLRLPGALFPFWLYSPMYWTEGRAWLSRYLDDSPMAAADAARAKALNAAGTLADFQGDAMAARTLLEECVAIRRQLPDRRSLAATLINLSNMLMFVGDLAAARAMGEESLAIMREVGDRLGILRALVGQADRLCILGEFRDARALAQEAVDIARGEPALLGEPLASLAGIELDDGYAKAAAAHCREALATKTVDGYVELLLLEAIARAESALGNPIRAAQIWGRLERMEKESSYIPPPHIQLRHERSVASARAGLGNPAEFDATWRRGAAMTTEQVIDFALDTTGT
jgi:non-specific serine/threonine protein kinase